jgi:hypothetical protein
MHGDPPAVGNLNAGSDAADAIPGTSRGRGACCVSPLMSLRAFSLAGAAGLVAFLAPRVGHAEEAAALQGEASPVQDAAVVEPAAPVVQGATAIDGEARGYERAPSEPASIPGAVLGGIGTGFSYVARGVLLPFRGAIYAEQRWQISHNLSELAWNDAHTFGVLPAASFSFDSGLTVGARALYQDFLGHGEQIAVEADTGGAVVQAYQLAVELPSLGPIDVEGRVRYEDNDHLRFQGIGNGRGDAMPEVALDPRAAAIETRFAQRRVLSTLRAGFHHDGFTVGASGIYNDRRFRAAPDTRSIEEVYDTSRVAGYDDGITSLELGVDAGYDGRASLQSAGGVVRAFAGAAPGHDSYLHYGGELEYHVSPFWPGRVLGARVALEGARAIDGDIPFTELPRLGGGSILRGYSTGQFRDRLAAIGTLEYRYPVHANLSGELFVEAGKVARTYDELAGRDDWHAAVGGGLLLHTRSQLKLRVDVAYGDGFHLFFGTDVLDAFRDREREL